MTPSKTLKLSAIAASLMLALAGAHAADKMTRDEFKTAKAKIEADYKTAKSACDGMKDNAKDVCQKEATAKEKVALAELDYSNTGKDSDRIKVEQVKAEQDYEVALERCDDRSGADKNACRAEAKAAEKRAQATIKAERKATSS